MSYNIDTWKTKKLENLVIPLDSFFVSDRTDWHPEKIFDEDGSICLSLSQGEGVSGKLIDGQIHVESIELRGEGSGTEMNLIVEPALKTSTGELIVSMIWEGGDSINKIIVKDGDVKWEDIEI